MYNPGQNVAYMRFRKQTNEVDTVRISDEVNIDLAPDGTICGIELLSANEQIPSLGGVLTLDTSTGTRTEVPWPGTAAS